MVKLMYQLALLTKLTIIFVFFVQFTHGLFIYQPTGPAYSK